MHHYSTQAECEQLRACSVDEAELDSYRNELLEKGREIESLKHDNKVFTAKEISLNRKLKNELMESDNLRDECARYKVCAYIFLGNSAIIFNSAVQDVG